MPNYGIIPIQKSGLPEIELLRVPHKGGSLITAVFGPNTYNANLNTYNANLKNANLKEMSREFYNSSRFPKVTFREPLTQESIYAAAYAFGSQGEIDSKRDIFNPHWLQAGRIVRTQDGVFTNTSETDETALEAMLNGFRKVNGICLIGDKIAFAPYESFEQGVQESGKFAESGLARALEHTQGKVAKNLLAIASTYPRGVNVGGFDRVGEPVSKIAGLGSLLGFGDGMLGVYGDSHGGNSYGYAFGVRETGGAS